MLRNAMIALFALLPMIAVAAPVKVGVDTSMSKIQWQGTKALVNDSHTGSVEVKPSSFLTVEGDKVVGGEIVVDMTTIKNEDVKDATYNAKLVDHLKSPDFFDVANHKEAKFTIKKGSVQPDGKMLFEGDLNIRGTTQPGKILATVTKEGNTWVATGKMDFDRTKFNIKYNSKDFFPNLVKSGKDKVINNEINLTFTLKTAAK